MDCSTPGFPVYYQLPEPTQTHVHRVGWWHPTSSSSVIPFSSCLQSFPASGSFPRSQFFASGGQSIGVSASASVLPMNIKDWFPLGLTGLISLQSSGLSWVFSNTTVQKKECWILSNTFSVSFDDPVVFIFILLICAMLSPFSCVRLCDPMDWSLAGSSIQGTLQARILEWIAMPSSNGSSQPRDQIHISYVSRLGRQGVYH